MKNNTYADFAAVNGRIYTVDDNFSVAQAMAWSGERLLCVGTDVKIQPYIGPLTKVMDLKGNAVLPGMMDAHVHLSMYGESLLRMQLDGKTKEEILRLVKKAVAALSPGQWLIGGMGWDNEIWQDPTYPTREELDEVSPHNPVLLPRRAGGVMWVNTPALGKAELLTPEGAPLCELIQNTPDQPSGCIDFDTARKIFQVIPVPTHEERLETLLAAQRQMLTYGLTGVNDAAANAQELEDLKELYEKGLYFIRFYGSLAGAVGDCPNESAREYLKHCPEIGLYGGRFTVRSVKLMADGTVGAQNAALFEDYTDRPGWRGTPMQSDEELYRMVKTAALKGMQVITHAIGDAGIDQILTAYERVLKEYPNPDHRFRIEHFQLVTGDSRERAKAIGVIASMQPLHGSNSAAMALRRLGPERAPRAYAVGMVHRVLGKFAGGSDAPVASPNPFTGIHAAVTRTNNELEPKGGFCPENAVSIEDAIRAYTIWDAYAQFAERNRGSLEAGKLADFVVLDRDPLNIPPDDLLNVKVLETVIGGKTVYKAQ